MMTAHLAFLAIRSTWEETMHQHPSRTSTSSSGRLSTEADALRRRAEAASHDERESLLERARRLDCAANIEGWLSSAELKPPT